MIHGPSISQPANLKWLLRNVAEDLDVPHELVRLATLKYQEVGAWLCAPDSKLLVYRPRIYPQGSFRLGTMIRPFTGEEEYDIDLVCLIHILKEATTQQGLKDMIGDRLKLNAEYNDMVVEGRRCWILDYPISFHMDVLPALPNLERKPDGILITDRELHRWQPSNPIGYANWFRERMIVQFNERRAILAKALSANIEDVPEWRVKTTLQRAIQLLKRHRDIRFVDDQENKPISIIITTLAAKAYDNTPDLYQALLTIIESLPKHIENRDGEYWVSNPVDEGENFADKWKEHPRRREQFYAWLDQVKEDLTIFAKADGIDQMAGSLTEKFGRDTVERATKRLEDDLSGKDKSNSPARFIASPLPLKPTAPKHDLPQGGRTSGGR